MESNVKICRRRNLIAASQIKKRLNEEPSKLSRFYFNRNLHVLQFQYPCLISALVSQEIDTIAQIAHVERVLIDARYCCLIGA
jgi:hypothetical protein